LGRSKLSTDFILLLDQPDYILLDKLRKLSRSNGMRIGLTAIPLKTFVGIEDAYLKKLGFTIEDSMMVGNVFTKMEEVESIDTFLTLNKLAIKIIYC
jgi:hypothetical protein